MDGAGLLPLLLRVILLLAAGLFAAPADAETRLALVITNAAYPSEVGALANPHKDGAVIAAALENVGFKRGNIAIVRDADQSALRSAVADFVERLEEVGPDAVAFLYYSGHGAADRTERGENYLIPVGARIALARQLPIFGVSLTEITKSLERVAAMARFVVIDACRNVAFTKGLKDASKGFVPERKLDGMIVAFATRPGETAEDNSIYATALASILPTPGLEAEQVFKETQRKVAAMSKGTQIPWTEDGLLTRFKFKDTISQAVISPATGQASEIVQAWKRLESSTDIRELEAFRSQYGKANPFYDLQAEARIEELKRLQVADAVPMAQSELVNPTQPAAATTPAPASSCDGVDTQVGNERRCLRPKDSFKDCPTCPAMVVVPNGSFNMGSPSEEPEREAAGEGQLRVAIATPFAVGRFAVTRGEFAAFVVATGHKADGGCYGYIGNAWKLQADHSWRAPGFGQTDRHPAVCIDWDDAKAYVAWVASTSGKSYRLLSEAEREYVARAGTTAPFWWGSAITPLQANYDGSADPYKGGGSKGESRKATVPVYSFAANPWGLYNVHGNVWEWTEDCWNDRNAGNLGDGSARTNGDCSRRVLRGGSWGIVPRHLRSAYRVGYLHHIRAYNFGVRLARTLR